MPAIELEVDGSLTPFCIHCPTPTPEACPGYCPANPPIYLEGHAPCDCASWHDCYPYPSADCICDPCAPCRFRELD